MVEIIIGKNDKILIVSPHPDDECIGCGGLISKYPNLIDVLLLTDGRKGHDETMNDAMCIKIRETEFDNAMQLAHINNIIKLKIPDGNVHEHYDTIKKIDISKYKYIFVPSIHDANVDHQSANKFFSKMYRKNHLKQQFLLEYEIGTSINLPSHYIDISEKMDMKLKLISLYASQSKPYDYIQLAKGINLYRGSISKVNYAEAYKNICPQSILRRIIYRIFRK